MSGGQLTRYGCGVRKMASNKEEWYVPESGWIEFRWHVDMIWIWWER